MGALTWGILTIVILIAELLTGTMFLYILAASTAVTAIGSYLFEMSALQEVFLFSGANFANYVIGIKWLKKSNVPLPTVNNPGAQFIGKEYTLTSEIINGRGNINISDSPWKIVGEDMPAGTVVVVVASDNGTLSVLESKTQ